MEQYNYLQYNLTEESLKYLTGRTKRRLDIIGAIVGIISTTPLFLLSMVITILIDRVPPLFKQERFGLNGKPFKMIKLRTLKIIESRDMVDKNRIQCKPNYKTTLTGKFWRQTSIDETIQFFLVLSGEMSLIGHRPIPMYYIPHLPEMNNVDKTNIDHYISTISKTKPGMSSLSSVNGRSNILMQQKFEFDLNYAQNANLGFDIKIIIKTLWVVLTCQDVK